CLSGACGRVASPVCRLACFGQSLTSDHTVHIVIADEKPYNIYVNDYTIGSKVLKSLVSLSRSIASGGQDVNDQGCCKAGRRFCGHGVESNKRQFQGFSRDSTKSQAGRRRTGLPSQPAWQESQENKVRKGTCAYPRYSQPVLCGNSKRNRR